MRNTPSLPQVQGCPHYNGVLLPVPGEHNPVGGGYNAALRLIPSYTLTHLARVATGALLARGWCPTSEGVAAQGVP